MLRASVLTASLLAASAAFSQQGSSAPPISGGSTDTAGGMRTMGDLLASGYEIKTSVPNGTKFIVFMQKDNSAYACEFVTVTNTRCGSIN